MYGASWVFPWHAKLWGYGSSPGGAGGGEGHLTSPGLWGEMWDGTAPWGSLVLVCPDLCEGRGHLAHVPLSLLLLCPILRFLCEYPQYFSYFWYGNTLLTRSLGRASVSCCVSGSSDSNHHPSWNLHVLILGKANIIFVNVLLSEFSLCYPVTPFQTLPSYCKGSNGFVASSSANQEDFLSKKLVVT